MYNYVSNNFWFTFLASVQDCDVNNPSNREKSFLLLCHGTKISRSQQTKIIISIYYNYWLVWFLCAWLYLGTKWSPTFPLSFDFPNDRLCQERLGWLILATERERQLTTGTRTERTERDFRCPICRSAIGQASCLVCTCTRQLKFPFCC